MAAVATGRAGEARVTVSVDGGGAEQVQLIGSFWSLHRLVIDLDRQLTTISRRPGLP